MKRLTTNSGIVMALALGLTLVLALFVLSSQAAPALSKVAGAAESYGTVPNAPAAELHVCLSGCTYSSIQDAVDAANNGDVIKVATGIYIDMNNYGGLAQVVYINKSVTIRGGYTIAFTDPPDPDANPTTLDAQGQGRVLYITGDINPTVEGLRITGGNATGLGGGREGDDAGGGVYIITATATIRDNRVFGNTAFNGGGLHLWSSAATISGNIITSNTADEDGGGLRLDNSAATINGNTITNNISNYDDGGGLVLTDSAATISNNIVSANIASDRGGGLFLENSPALISGNTISSNFSGGWRGGGGLHLENSDATLSANTIFSNTAQYGGGVYLVDSTATLSGNTISSNTADFEGGGVYLQDSAATLSDNTITNNTAPSWGGGGLRLEDSPATLSGNTVSANSTNGSGGGLSLHSSDVTLNGNIISTNIAGECGGLAGSGVTLINNIVVGSQVNVAGSGLCIGGSSRLLHNTIARNTGGDGSGVRVSGSVALTNTILVSQTVGVTVTAGNTATLQGTLWGSGAWANTTDWGGDGDIITGTVNVWGDPAFVAPDVGDYHIGSASAAIDAGIDAGITNDMDGQPRPHYDGHDLGADEWWPLVAFKMATPDIAEPGDVVTYTLILSNTTDAAMTVRLTDTLPSQVDYVGPITYTGGTVGLPSRVITWTGTVLTATPTLITWPVRVASDVPFSITIPNTATIQDAYGLFQTTPAVILVPPRYIYLPLVLRNFP